MSRVLPIALLLLSVPALMPGQAAQLPLTLEEATRRALERNTALAVEREEVAQAGFAVLGAHGAYDFFWNADIGWRQHTDPVNSAFSGAPGGGLAPEDESVFGSTSFSRLLPTGGTVSFFSGADRSTTDNFFTPLSPAYSTDVGVAFRQPLLRNLAIDPAREAIRVAMADQSASEARLSRVVTETIRQVDTAYWILVAARRDVTSIESSIVLAEKQLSDTKARVEAGDLGETEIAQPTAERERRKGNLALARQVVAQAENTLKFLMFGDARDPAWASTIVPTDEPEVTPVHPDVDQALETAFVRRPEIAEAKARSARFETQVEGRQSDLKPRLDVVAAYERRGFAGKRNPDAIGFGGQPIVIPPSLEGTWDRSYGTIADNEFPDASIGLSFSFPIGNRTARANLAAAKSELSQATMAVSSEEQLVQAEVRNAAFALESALQRVEATRASRAAAETQLYAEQERFAVGLSTNFLVLTRQNDLTAARVTETGALTDYRKALTEFARATGVLLDERGIRTPEPPGGSGGM
jgi:outer membrane protein TolC